MIVQAPGSGVIHIGFVGPSDIADVVRSLLPDDTVLEPITPEQAVQRTQAGTLEMLVVAADAGNWRQMAGMLSPMTAYAESRPVPVFALVPRSEPESLVAAFAMLCADCAWLPVEPLELEARLAVLVRRRRVAMARAAETQRAWVAATRDVVTGLFNRRFLDDELPRAIAVAQSSGQPLSLLMADIDGLKLFNDRRGHPAGDRALRKVAETIVANMRSHDRVARYGGDEIAVIMPGADLPEARSAAARLVTAVGALELGCDAGPELRAPLTLSVGVSALRGPACRARTLIARSDEALYAAKREGRNRSVAA